MNFRLNSRQHLTTVRNVRKMTITFSIELRLRCSRYQREALSKTKRVVCRTLSDFQNAGKMGLNWDCCAPTCPAAAGESQNVREWFSASDGMRQRPAGLPYALASEFQPFYALFWLYFAHFSQNTSKIPKWIKYSNNEHVMQLRDSKWTK